MPNHYASGTKILANDGNQSLPITLTAGETINGATLPVAVYMDDTDNELKACDGNDTATLEFIGFAISNSTDGNDITIQTKGIVDGFSGLDVGKKYYVQDDKTIGTSPGTVLIHIGYAISATQILIINGPEIPTKVTFSASDNLIDSHDTEYTTQSETFIERVSWIVQFSGTIRVKGDIKTGGDGQSYFVAHKNDILEGESGRIGATYETKSIDITVVKGDEIQLGHRVNTASYTSYVRNLRIYYTKLSEYDTITQFLP